MKIIVTIANQRRELNSEPTPYSENRIPATIRHTSLIMCLFATTSSMNENRMLIRNKAESAAQGHALSSPIQKSEGGCPTRV
jgi:hypothetical protein